MPRLKSRDWLIHGRRWGLLALFVVTALILGSCYPDSGFNSVSDYDVVATHYDTQANFDTLRTYAMPDSIFHLTEDGKDDSRLSRNHDTFILNRIRDNMEAKGYELKTYDSLEDFEQDPSDLVLLVTATGTTYRGYYYSGGCWYYYYCGYYPWYGGSYEYSTGTVFLTMFDVARSDPDTETYQGVWGAGLNGLLSGSTYSTQDRIGRGLDTAFKQSPYLGPAE